MPLANVLPLEDIGQNLEEADMVNIPDLIDEILEKNKKRATKKNPTVKAGLLHTSYMHYFISIYEGG